ncbi:trypsin-like peptidase domain-containing protein [Gordonia sp. CPCC 205515]|uniref:S1C family serine protease n=1 Tax=Gordonia sp. CPCC 205515 TaxID=3140791 RepID=UPI003AF37A23
MATGPSGLGRPAGPAFVVAPPTPPSTTAPPRTSIPTRIGGPTVPPPSPTTLPTPPTSTNENQAPQPKPRSATRRAPLMFVASLVFGGIAGATAGLVATGVALESAAPQPPSSISTGQGVLDGRRAAAALMPSVVQVRAGAARGSGFAFDEAGHVLTNAHVVGGSAAVEVQLANGEQRTARVVGRDPAVDLAVIRLDGTGPPSGQIGDSSALLVGQPVIAVGSPLGLSSTVTAGIVSAVDRMASLGGPAGPTQQVVQTDASINPGNSGGPLADLDGRVIGVNTAIATVGGPESGNIGIGFAIPIDRAMIVARRIIAGG